MNTSPSIPTPRGGPVAPWQRHTRSNPCKICDGYAALPPGKGIRCAGFTSEDGVYEHCTREEYAGGLPPTGASPITYAHKLQGPCACGTEHGSGGDEARHQRLQIDIPRYTRVGEASEGPSGPIWASYDCIPLVIREGGRSFTCHHKAPYLDGEGKVVAEIWRYEEDVPGSGKKPGKLVRPRSPIGDGRWIGTRNERALPLYHLPRLLSAPPDMWVFVTEGEKKADRLQDALDESGVDSVVVCAAGGAEKWRGAVGAEEALVGRRLVILPDNDAPGRRHADQVCDATLGCAAEVRLVQLPGLNEKEDIADWLDGGGTVAELMALVDGTLPVSTQSEEEGEEDIDIPTLAQSAQAIESFPLDVLPTGIRAFVAETALALNCTPDLVGVAALVALSIAIGTSRALEVKPGREVLPALDVAIIADPGESKTPAINAALKPLQDLERRAYRQWQADLRAWEQHGEEPGAQRGPRPTYSQIVVSDTTMEALTDVLQSNPRGVVIARDELSGWVHSMDQYRGGKGADRQNWLSLWSSEPISVNRRGNGLEPRRIERPFASVIGGIQPGMLEELMDKHGREDGFLHRLLFCWPQPTQRRWTDRYVSDEVKERYTAIINNLLALQPHADDEGESAPVRLPFSAEAQRLWGEWYDMHFSESEQRLPVYLRGPWAKLEAYAARLALIVHLARVADGDTAANPELVDVASLIQAFALIEYFKTHAHRVYALLHASPEDRRLTDAVAWVRRKPSGCVVTAREAQQAHVGGVRSAEEAKALLAQLAELGYGFAQEVASRRGRPSFQFVRK